MELVGDAITSAETELNVTFDCKMNLAPVRTNMFSYGFRKLCEYTPSVGSVFCYTCFCHVFHVPVIYLFMFSFACLFIVFFVV